MGRSSSRPAGRDNPGDILNHTTKLSEVQGQSSTGETAGTTALCQTLGRNYDWKTMPSPSLTQHREQNLRGLQREKRSLHARY